MARFLVSFSLLWAFASAKHLGSRIVNGEPAEDGQFPWQVAIFGRSSAVPSYLCGGALISEEWVLTAGHCVEGATAATIYSGVARISNRNRTTSQATDFILHEEYDGSYLNNDIGLIRLRQPLTFTDNVRAIALAEEETQEDTRVTVTGWGDLQDGDPNPYSDALNYIELSTISNPDCVKYYNNRIVYDGLVCTAAGDPLGGPCLGDSGAPVVTNPETDPIHVAVFSFFSSLGCESLYPAGNTRTASYRDWIRNKTGI